MARLPNGEGEDSKGIVDRMRVVVVIALAVVASFLAAMGALFVAAVLGLVAQAGPHQEFEILAITAGVGITALGAAVIFTIVLVAGGKQPAIRRTAIVLMVFLVLVLAIPDIFGLATADGGDLTAADLGPLTIFLIVVAVAGLLVILIQWLVIRRHVVRNHNM